jgi:hypothetical protein
MNKLISWTAVALGIIFLVIPIIADGYAHYLQDLAFRYSQEKVLTCRAQLALSLYEKNPTWLASGNLPKSLDVTCGAHPRYDDYTYTQSGILTLYAWIGQKVNFIPL